MACEVNSVPLSLTTMQGVPRIVGDPIQFAGDTDAGERGVDDQGQAFPA